MKTYKPGGAGAATPALATNGTDDKQVIEIVGSGQSEDCAQGDHQSIDPGPFPIQALNDVMRLIAEETAEVHQIPIELPAMAAVATMAGAMGTAFELTGAVNGKSSFGGIYVIPGAPKSTGKGAASSVAAPLITASAELAAEFLANELPGLKIENETLKRESEALYKKIIKSDESGGEMETLKARLRENQQKMDGIAPLLIGSPTYWVSNATSEAMSIQFARNNSSLFAFSPEAGEAVRVMLGKYRGDSKGDFDLWLSGYSVEVWRSDRVQRGTLEIKPCLSALLFCQPSVLRELISNEEAFERGLTARVLPFIVEPKLMEDDGVFREISDDTNEMWDALIRRVLAMRRGHTDGPPQPRRIICSAGAREAFRAFHNESIRLRNGEYRDVEGELGRWRENAIRLSLGQCVADDPNASELSEEQALRGIEFARWCVLNSLAIMHTGRMERRLKRAQELQSRLVDYGGKQTLRELERRHGYKREEMIQLTTDFPELLRYEKSETGKAGRPSEMLSTL